MLTLSLLAGIIASLCFLFGAERILSHVYVIASGALIITFFSAIIP